MWYPAHPGMDDNGGYTKILRTLASVKERLAIPLQSVQKFVFIMAQAPLCTIGYY